MSTLVPINLPPGAYRPGSLYQAKERWYDMNLMRWHEDAMQPIGGWSETIAAASVDSKPVRSMFSWRINTGISRLMLGTYQRMYVYDDETGAATCSNVTPSSGFTAASSDDARYAWHMDNFGEDILAVLPRDQFAAAGDGKLWQYSAAAPTSPMVAVTNSPIGLRGVVCTPERFIFALGTNGDPRRIDWPDQESLTDWTPTDVNQAGNFTLQTNGKIMAGKRARRETLIWTDEDLWAATYINEELVYGFRQVGTNGAMSARSMYVKGSKAIWMGKNGFFEYDGYERQIPCEVGDYIFGKQPSAVSPANAGIDRTKAAWVFCYANDQFGEITWHYVSQGTTGTGTENDRYVTYNTITGKFYIGALARTAGVQCGRTASFGRPMLAGTTGAVYQHETAGVAAADWGGTLPYAESGPFELGNGDNVMTVLGWVPDSKSLGQWSVILYTGDYPTGSETASASFTAANPTNMRQTGRQARVRFTAVDGTTTHRLGVPRLAVAPRGKR